MRLELSELAEGISGQYRSFISKNSPFEKSQVPNMFSLEFSGKGSSGLLLDNADCS